MGKSVNIGTIKLAYTPWEACETPTSQLTTSTKYITRRTYNCRSDRNHTSTILNPTKTAPYWHEYPIGIFYDSVQKTQTPEEIEPELNLPGAPSTESPDPLPKDDYIAEEMSRLLEPYQKIVNNAVTNGKKVQMAGAWGGRIVNTTYTYGSEEVELRYGPSQLPEEIVIRRLDDAGNMTFVASIGLDTIFDPGARSANEQIHKHVAEVVGRLVRSATARSA